MIEKILLPHVNKEQGKMNRPNQAALVTFNVCRCQIINDVQAKLYWHCLCSCRLGVILQPLKLKKKKLKKSIEEIDVKLQLTSLKALQADWVVELYNKMIKSEAKEVSIDDNWIIDNN